MTQFATPKLPTLNRALSVASATALAAAVAVALSAPAHAENVTAPSVPESLKVEEGNVPYLVGHAVGTQNYVCVPNKDGKIDWALYTPQATLFSDGDRQIITHFFSPNPLVPGEFLPTWQHSRDTSAVWVKASAPPYTEEDFVERGAVAWLTLRVVTAVGDPGDLLTQTSFIQRVNTSGGLAPAAGCAESGDVGGKALMPYSADYFFFRQAEG